MMERVGGIGWRYQSGKTMFESEDKRTSNSQHRTEAFAPRRENGAGETGASSPTRELPQRLREFKKPFGPLLGAVRGGEVGGSSAHLGQAIRVFVHPTH